jgi:hypothetical protein
MTCETFGGAVLDRYPLVVSRGQRTSAGLAACSRAVAGAFRSGRGCDRPTRRARGAALDRVKLGSDRRRNLRRYRVGRRGRGSIDEFCLSDRSRVRVGYPTARLRRALGRRARRVYAPRKAVVILTSSKRFRIGGVRVGTRVRGKIARLFRTVPAHRVGRTRWYLARGSKARILYKVRRGRVHEIGIADRRLTGTRNEQRRFLSSWRGEL